MKVGAENYWRLNGIRSPWMRTRTKMLRSFESHQFNLVIQLLSLPLDRSKVKYSTVKCKHFSAVLVYFAKVFRESSV